MHRRMRCPALPLQLSSSPNFMQGRTAVVGIATAIPARTKRHTFVAFGQCHKLARFRTSSLRGFVQCDPNRSGSLLGVPAAHRVFNLSRPWLVFLAAGLNSIPTPCVRTACMHTH